METTPLQRFLDHLSSDPELQVKVQAAVSAEVVAVVDFDFPFQIQLLEYLEHDARSCPLA